MGVKMTKGKKMVIFIMLVLFFCTCLIFLTLFRTRNIDLWDEICIEKTTPSYGLSWLIISNEKQAERIASNEQIKLPNNNFSINYLLISDGRKIKSLTYKKISKYQWEYDVPMGIAEFDETLNSHSIYVYKIPKIVLKQDGD